MECWPAILTLKPQQLQTFAAECSGEGPPVSRISIPGKLGALLLVGGGAK
jgi:hypothetical protein